MIKSMNLEEMEIVKRGDKVDIFCAGFAAGLLVYAVGVYANWWNPVGWSGGALLLIVNLGCAAYGLR